jgi:hypothetical protein
MMTNTTNLKMVVLPLPAQDAPPKVVRTYFSTILTQFHDIPEAEAEKIAANWRYAAVQR